MVLNFKPTLTNLIITNNYCLTNWTLFKTIRHSKLENKIILKKKVENEEVFNIYISVSRTLDH